MFKIDTNHSTIYLYKKKIIFSFIIVIDEQQSRYCLMNFYALSSAGLFSLVNKHKGLFLSISFHHILYIGKEIYKAELSQLFKQRYIQS